MKLSATQQRALGKLTRSWRTAYDIQEGIHTLRALVRKGLAGSSYPIFERGVSPEVVFFWLTEAGRKDKP